MHVLLRGVVLRKGGTIFRAISGIPVQVHTLTYLVVLTMTIDGAHDFHSKGSAARMLLG